MNKFFGVVVAVVLVLLGIAVYFRREYLQPVIILYTDSGFVPSTITITPKSNVVRTLIFKNESSKPFRPVTDLEPTSFCMNDPLDAQIQGRACESIPPGGSWSMYLTYGGMWVYHDEFNSSTKVTVNIIGLPQVPSGDRKKILPVAP